MKLKDQFKLRFGHAPTVISRAPGRVNLIGEHTDYNEGFVFPAAIDRTVSIVAAPRTDDIIEVHSLDYSETDVFNLNQFERSQQEWTNYLRGVVSVLKEAGHKLTGFNAVLTGDIPQRAGLSSSAAYEVAVAFLINDMCGLQLTRRELASIAQKAENEFVGVQCGIMDQFVSALGEPYSALLIDCRSLEYRAVKMNLVDSEAAIVVTNSGVERGLVDSEYNLRRNECKQGVEQIGQLLQQEFQSLRDVSIEQLQECESKLPETIMKRCRHVITENRRVLDAVRALECMDLNQFGKLMNQSHASLRDDFQVSCKELDVLVGLTQDFSGALGARMMGGGFGGCTVALMKKAAVDDFTRRIVPEYESQTGRKADIYICRAGAGATLEH